MLDRLISEFDKGLRTIFATAHTSRPFPDNALDEAALNERDKRHAAALMRVNHCGEVCAQALYNGQALTAKNPETAALLQQASREETEHLAWCESRIHALGGRTSLLNPFFYMGSFALGAVAGALGDRWNLGFVQETERQVEAHLQEHMQKLPETDTKSRAVLEQMRTDEIHHANTAEANGAAELPLPAKLAMKITGKLMTHTAYWV